MTQKDSADQEKSNPSRKKQVAMIYAALPSPEEMDQLRFIAEEYDLKVISSESIVHFLSENTFFSGLECISLPDHDEDTTFLPGLESLLEKFDIVILKERVGVYAYQVVKAKWRFRFQLIVWVDNLSAFPGEDVLRMRTVRTELMNVADGFLVQSKAARDVLLLEGVSKDRIFFVPAWIDQKTKRSPALKNEALRKLGLSEEAFVILFQGQIEWEESLCDLLYSIKLLVQEDAAMKRRLKLIVYGIGAFANELKVRSITLGIDQHLAYYLPTRETFVTLLRAADCLFMASVPSRDRLDGDISRYISAMVHQIPVISPRSVLTEETLNKHRFDFCQGSYKSLSRAMKKAVYAPELVNDIKEKNFEKAQELVRGERVKKALKIMFKEIQGREIVVDRNQLDSQVHEVEKKVEGKQFLAAIAMIESIFKVEDLPRHHSANLYRLVGDCFTKLGDHDAGKKAYIQAVELDPYSAKAHIGLGTVALIRRNYDIAVIHFQKAVMQAPDDEMANLGLGLSFQGLDELSEASKWVAKALAINPENVPALYTMVRIAGEREDYHDAEGVLRVYLARHPHDHNMAYTLGGILYKLGKFEEVIAVLQDVININPMDGRTQTLMRQARRGLEKGAKASVG